MSWEAVARKDFRDAVRSRTLWALSALFVLVFSVPTVLRFFVQAPANAQQAQQGVVSVFIFLIKEATAVLVPLIAIVVAYAAITRERESGTLKLLLSLPHSRDDVVVGKVLGRSAVVALPIAVGFAVAALVLLAAGGTFDPAVYVGFAVLTAALGVVFVAVAVGISAATESTQRAVYAAVGYFLVVNFGWNWLANKFADGMQQLLGLGSPGRYEVLLFVKLLNPIQAYKTLVDSLLGPALAARQQMFGFFLFPDPAAQEALGESLAVPFTDPFVGLYLSFWVFAPVALGLWSFRERDL
ncbi:MAG: ABC transporter permease subunit [Halolamina sp.]